MTEHPQSYVIVCRRGKRENSQQKLAQLHPGVNVLAEVTIGKDVFWWPGQVKKHTANGQLVVEVEFKDIADEKHYATVTVGPEKLRLAKENK